MPLSFDGTMPTPPVGSTNALSQYLNDAGMGSLLLGPMSQRPAPAGGGGGLGIPSDNPLWGVQIYMGSTRSPIYVDDTARGFGSQNQYQTIDQSKSIKELTDEFYAGSRKDQKNLAFLLTLAGFAGGDLKDVRKDARALTLTEVEALYHELLQVVATKNGMGEKITPEQYLRDLIMYRLPRSVSWDGKFSSLGDALQGTPIGAGPSSLGIDGEEEPFTGTKTVTDHDKTISRNIMDPADAKAITRAMLQQELGRDPTSEEFEDFINTLQHAQRVNPNVTNTNTKTTYTYEEGEVVDTDRVTNSTTRAGITSAGLSDLALQKARSNPSWAEWQAMGTYAPALFDALGATIEGR